MSKRAGRKRIARVPKVSKLQRNDVTREEFNHVIEMLNERGEIINQIRRELELQFRRMAQIQAQLDRVATMAERDRLAFGTPSSRPRLVK
jgi:hypothetical protein